MKWPIDRAQMKDKGLIYGSLFLAILLIAVSFVAVYIPHQKAAHKQKPLAAAPLPDPFANTNVQILAKAALVYDIKTGKVIYAKNADERLPLASLTKVLTAVTAVELMPKTAIVTINDADLNEDGDNGLYLNEQWKLSDIINFSLVVSSNDGAEAIAGAAGAFANPSNPSTMSEDDFVDLMNKTAARIGMQQAQFFNPSGLDDSTSESGGYGSAEDIATLMSYALKNHPDILADTKYPTLTVTSLNGITHTIDNTDTLINTIPGLVASKTGNTDLAGGNLSIVMDPGLDDPISITILGSSYDGRFTDMQTLVNETMTYLTQGNGQNN